MCVFVLVFFGFPSLIVVSSLRSASGRIPDFRDEMNALKVSFRYGVGIISGDLYWEFWIYST